MCILLKLDYKKFGVSNLFFSSVIEEKPLGVGSTNPPLVQKGLKMLFCFYITILRIWAYVIFPTIYLFAFAVKL